MLLARLSPKPPTRDNNVYVNLSGFQQWNPVATPLVGAHDLCTKSSDTPLTMPPKTLDGKTAQPLPLCGAVCTWSLGTVELHTVHSQ